MIDKNEPKFWSENLNQITPSNFIDNNLIKMS